jgi:hypothetical protein
LLIFGRSSRPSKREGVLVCGGRPREKKLDGNVVRSVVVVRV